MLKIVDKETQAALRVALSITRKKIIDVTSGKITARGPNVCVCVACEHVIPVDRYTCRDYFLTVHEGLPVPLRKSTPGPDAKTVGTITAAAPFVMQMELTELTGHVYTSQKLRPLSMLYKGQPITVTVDRDATFFTVRNITLVVTRQTPVTNVLITGLPVVLHQALKELAGASGTSVNKIILRAIKKELT